MDTKVITLFVILILLCFGLALFGLANQDIITNKEAANQNFETIKTDDATRTCKNVDAARTVTYQFVYNEDKSAITKMYISYKSNYPNHEKHLATVDIFKKAQGTLDGIQTFEIGDEENFYFMMTTDQASLNEEQISVYKSDLDLLTLVIPTTTSPSEYESLITLNNTLEFTCEDITE